MNTFSPENLNILYRYGIALTNSPDLAMDVLQAALEKMIMARQSEHIDNENAYVRKLMRNGWYDELRRQKTRRKHLNEQTEIDHEPISVIDHNPIESMLITDDMLVRIWATLDHSQRELLFYSCVLEFSAQQIADEMETPRGTILARLNRLKKRIRGECQDIPVQGSQL